MTLGSAARAATARPRYSGVSLFSNPNCCRSVSVLRYIWTRSVRMKPGMSVTHAMWYGRHSTLMPRINSLIA